MTKFVSALIVLAMLALPGQALAQGSGGDVYTEDPPTAGNGNPPGGNDGGSSPSSGTPGDAAVQSEDSAAAADLAESTDPDGDGSSAGGSSGSGSGNDGSGSSGVTSSGSSAGVDDVVGEIAGGSDDGAGILLPMILGAVLLAGVAFVVIRRRGGSPGTA